MSEQQNIALIQSVYDAFAKGDIQFILDRLTHDVEWSMAGPSIIPYTGMRKGPSQVKGFFEALGGTQTNMKLTIESMISQGDRVFGLGHFAATVIATGKSYDSALGHFWTIRDGMISRFVDVVETASVADAHVSASAVGR
jgi:ketosteroid isomerase-like protein